MNQVEFNLLDEPWIRVRDAACRVQEVSLADALLRAQEFTDLAGEMPTQDAAVLRLLLAVLQSVFCRVDAAGESAPLWDEDDADAAVERWEELWSLGRIPEAPVRRYLARWHDRFWLFHPERPFYQVPEAEVGTEYAAAKLNGEIAESGNKLRLFSAYAGAGKAELRYAQAARWLLYVNGYDDTSAKPKGKNLPSPGAGWLGKIGLIYATGANLFETLLLNLVLAREDGRPWGEPRPCWELDAPRSRERTEIAPPDNQAELLTLQSRRLLLHRSGDKVTGYSLLGGDFFGRENAFFEQRTVWRRRAETKNAPAAFLPKRHDPAQQFWREFPSVFVKQKEVQVPGIVSWLGKLQEEDERLGKRMLHFRIVGVEYGDKDFFVTDAFQDGLSFHASLLEELGRSWRAWITEEIAHCEQLAQAVGSLAYDLSLASGDKPTPAAKTAAAKAQRAREQFYFQIDQPFRQWLYEIEPEWGREKTQEHIASWRSQALRIARTLGQRLVDRAGDAAFVGRKITMAAERGGKKGETKSFYFAAPKSFSYFQYRIRTEYKEKQ